MEAFIQQHGVTKCPPVAPRTYSPAQAKDDTGRIDWLNDYSSAARTPEENLAINKFVVMFKALAGQCMDYNRSDPKHKEKARCDAHRWFFESKDFEQWCDMAGFLPEYVREKAKRVYAEGLPRTDLGCSPRADVRRFSLEVNRAAQIRAWKKRR